MTLNTTRKNRTLRLTILSAVLAFACACASRGTPSGGRADYDPPVPLAYFPENYSTNFQAKKIEVVFDERIKYKDLSKQLVVSPPIQNIIQYIKPTASSPSRTMSIDLSQVELLPNTTYTLNFGNSVGDNHEGTAIPNFKYVFSTGEKIDSLVVGGIVEDAFAGKFDPKTVIMLYRVDSTFNDSTIFKERPMYFTRLANERDSTFRIDNISPGTYQLIAMVDDASNMKYDQSKDKIAFFPRYLELKEPSDQGYLMRLALARPSYKVYQGVNQQKGLIEVPIAGLEPSDSIFRLSPELADTARDYYIFSPERDTLRYWFTGDEKDSILFLVKHNGAITDTINAKIRKPAEVEFAAQIATKNLDLNQSVFIRTNKPIDRIDTSMFFLADKDSIPRPFTLSLDSANLAQVEMKFRTAPDNNYHIMVLPAALTSILGENPKDTLITALKTKTNDDYGKLKIRPVSFKQFPVIFQMVSPDGKTVYKEAVCGKSGDDVSFDLISPASYHIRAILDANGNGRWDTVDYLKKQQPERIIYMDKPVNIRAMWEEEIEW